MSSFQPKITRHTEKQENMTHSKEKGSTETVHEKDLMTDLLDKDFRTTIINMVKELKEIVGRVKKTMQTKWKY